MPPTSLSPDALTVLRVLSEAQARGEVGLSLSRIVTLTGFADKAKARYVLLLLSDRRLIDGHGTARALTSAGCAALAEAESIEQVGVA